jgi:hypothetical protein
MALLILLVFVVGGLWILARHERAELDELRWRIAEELAAMEAVDRLFEARDRARVQMRRALRDSSKELP